MISAPDFIEKSPAARREPGDATNLPQICTRPRRFSGRENVEDWTP
jgi:hypothetical protein